MLFQLEKDEEYLLQQLVQEALTATENVINQLEQQVSTHHLSFNVMHGTIGVIIQRSLFYYS